MHFQVLEKCEKPFVAKTGEIYSCGQCPSCQRAKIREWSIRACHELDSYSGVASFITLSYAPKHLPKGAKKPQVEGDKLGVLVPRDATLFIKRLRKYCDRVLGKKIRYLLCGEYGTKYWRPHFHILVYGVSCEEWSQSAPIRRDPSRALALIKSDEHRVKTEGQKVLQEIWGKGLVDLDVKPMHEYAAQYVVGYIRKKIGSKYGGKEIYEDNGRPRPYMTTSKGIGGEWSRRHEQDWLKTLEISWQGHQFAIPRYYIKRIYREEGEVIKLTVKNKEEEFYKTEKSYYYKIIKNPLGEKTRQIIEGIEKKKHKALDKYLEDKDYIKQSEIISYFTLMQQKNKAKLMQELDLYENLMNRPYKTTKQIHSRIFMNRAIRLKKIKEGKSNKRQTKGEISEIFQKLGIFGTYEEAAEKARLWNKNLRQRDMYGRRDSYENNEELRELGA